MEEVFVLGFIGLFFLFTIFLLTVIAKATYKVNQAEAIIIERLGRFHSILKPGLHFIIPFIDSPRSTPWTFLKQDPYSRRYVRITKFVDRIELRESVYDFPKQNVITKDNVTMEINALLYYQITDPQRAIYEVNNLPEAIEKLTQTTLRNVIGSMDLDESLVSRDQINETLRIKLDDATDKWGVKVNRVELQEVSPPADIRLAMEKQMKAERERRAVILESEGNKRSEILEAEGNRQAKIERANGEAAARVALAKADAEARVTVANAEAEAIRMINEALPSTDPAQYIIATNYIKALPEMTKDKEGKLVLLPYEASAMMGSFAGIKELFKAQDKNPKSK